jgi:transcriptional regulator with XRE-family HTH domain
MATPHTRSDGQRTNRPSPLKIIRLDRRLRLVDVAERTGITASHLSRIEAGDRLPSVPVLTRLSRVLGLRELEQQLQRYVDSGGGGGA